jgi:tetratricopeptide (TPR) repeat protein
VKKSIIIFSILYSFICNGQTAEVYYNRGIAKARLERYRLAVADFSNAIEINPDFRKAFYERGLAKG